MPDYKFLLIGGGMTADAAARGIRETGEAGSIGLISAEPHPPYDRPPLSKGLWADQPLSEIWRETHDLNVKLHLGRSAVTLDPAAKTVRDAAGDEYTYGKLLLATGGTPRRLAGPDEDVIYFRTLADYELLRELTRQPRRIAVIGGGYIGAEIAAALSRDGHQVQVAFLEEALLSRLLPPELARHVSSLFEQQGVQLLPGRSVRSVTRNSAGLSRVAFESGEPLTADIVIAGLGIIPETQLARSAGLSVSDGIDVDEFLRTSAPDVYAAGDVANFPSAALGGRCRPEHEDNANMAGFQAGRNMAGQEAAYAHLPLFYSDLFDTGFEGVGRVDPHLETVSSWEEPLKKGTVYYLEDGRLQGALFWNVWGKVDRARELIAGGQEFRVEDF